MLWGLFKLMWGLVTLPLRLVWMISKLAAFLVLPIIIMKAFKRLRK
jgi:hypothetical protein